MIFIVITVWISNLLFGLYILSFYLGNAMVGKGMAWNQKLPELFDATHHVATGGIFLHFIAGSIILMLGSIQLLASVRIRFPKLHRILGQLYIAAALLAAIGGLIFIVTVGTVGGAIMDIGFAGYGILMIICAAQTYRYARQRDLTTHRRWAIRLFALAVGSWLYRMDYGFWYFLTGGIGHSKDFHGYFDKLMVFFFYLPNLYVVELIDKCRTQFMNPASQLIGNSILALTSILVMLGTYEFLTISWWPAIKSML